MTLPLTASRVTGILLQDTKKHQVVPRFYCSFLTSLYVDKWPHSELPCLTTDIYALGNETQACLWIGNVCCSAELCVWGGLLSGCLWVRL